MKLYKKQPKDGAFVMLWLFNGHVHAESYEYTSKGLMHFKNELGSESDSWEESAYDPTRKMLGSHCTNVCYVCLSKETQLTELLNK